MQILLNCLLIFFRVLSGAVIGETGSFNLSIEPKIRNGENGIFIEADTRKSLTCRTIGKDHKVEWLDPEGNAVKRTSGRVFAQEHYLTGLRAPAAVLTFAPANVQDIGVWTCRSGDLKQSVPICVIEKAIFTETNNEIIQEMGRAITLSCQVRGHPEPRLYWIRNGKIISDYDVQSSKYKVMEKYNRYGLEGFLTIISLEPEDKGTYTCVAVQESAALLSCVYEQNVNLTLHVSHAPILQYDNITRNVYGKYNESVTLNCTANAYPPPVYTWFLKSDDSVFLELNSELYFHQNSTKAVLELIVNETSLKHTFQCRARNIYGESELIFKVRRTVKPTKPKLNYDYRESNDTKTKFTITWNNDVSFMIDEIHVKYIDKRSLPKHLPMPTESDWNSSSLAENFIFNDEKDGHSVILTDLNAKSEYWIRIQISNEMGYSPWSDPLLFSTSAAPEENVDVEESKETNVKDEISITFYSVFLCSIVIVVIAFTMCVKKI